jgi:alanine racemase
MDITLVDVTDVAETLPGDEVVLFGERGDRGTHEDELLGVEEVAAAAGTIPHEILCRVGSRVPRRYLSDGFEQTEEPGR